MDWYSVTVEARSPDGAGQIDDDAVDAFADRIAEHSGTVSAGGSPPRYAATFSLQKVNALGASRAAADLVRAIARDVGLPNWPVVRLDVVREDVHAEELAQPTMPDLVSGPEAAEMLGVCGEARHGRMKVTERSSLCPPHENAVSLHSRAKASRGRNVKGTSRSISRRRNRCR